MIKIILAISLLFVTLGCASTPFFKPSKASRLKFLESDNTANLMIRRAIIDGDVVEGMTVAQVRTAWGDPDRVTNKYSDDCKNCAEWFEDGEEMWTYKWDLFSSANKKVRFKDGIVVEVLHQYK